MDLIKFGWNNHFKEKFVPYEEKGFFAGRISSEHKNLYRVITEKGEMLGEVSGKMRYSAGENGDFPAVGDWVVISFLDGQDRVIIHNILERKSKFSRKVAGINTKEQIAASNIDYVFLVNALNKDFNVRRIERYLILAWESGASPVIILSKADLCHDVDIKLADVEKIAFGVPVHVISSIEKAGFDELNKYFLGNKTVVLLGSSGVGKSTLINELAGEHLLDTGEINEYNDRGRHTTTYRQLVVLPGGGIVIDTPGMRELQLWDGSEGISETFEDIEGLAKECYFGDCKHQREPGCAVKKAINEGIIDAERLENYRKLQKELRYLELKQSRLERVAAKKGQRTTDKDKHRSEYDYV